MANIIWTPPDGWVEESGAHVSFKAPCDCSAAGNLVIGSNSYSIVDAIGGKLTGSSGVFVSGAVLDFILDCENLKAYLQNPATSEITTSGSVTITPPSGGGTTYVWVSFSKAFPSVPCVVATAKTSVPGNCACGVTSVNTSGFRLYLYRNGSTATTVNWIAISS